MSTSGITSSLLSSIASSPSTANSFVTDLNQLSKDLQGGNLSAAQDDYVTLSQDALNGATASTATTSASGITTALLSDIASSSSSSSAFASALNQLGTDLAGGNLSSAQGDLLSLDSTALNAVPSSSSNPSSTSSATNKADVFTLISATLQAMEVGDSSAIGSDLSQLASISPSSDGAGYLKSDSESYGPSTSTSTSSSPSTGSSASSAASSINQLLQSASSSNSSNSSSPLSLFA